MATPLSSTLTDASIKHKANNIILMTDGYKFSHHKQYPVSWMPPHARGKGDSPRQPPVLFAGVDGKQATQIFSIRPVPTNVADSARALKVCIVTNVATAVVTVERSNESADFTYDGKPLTYGGATKENIIFNVAEGQRKVLNLPTDHGTYKFVNIDESKLKRGSNLNANYEGGYNVSYFTPRCYNDNFDYLTGDDIVFFGLQYFMKEYLEGKVVTQDKIDEADSFIGRYMADVRIAGPDFANGYDFTMFPKGDWQAMLSGDYEETGIANPAKQGRLPIKIEALPEGTLQAPGVCSFKITNTHPRFFWLPNFLETLLVQVWYPMSVATQAREFRKTIQAYSVLSQRVAWPPAQLGPPEFNEKNIADDKLAIHIAQVFDLLDFGYRGVSSHETAALGSAAYYTTGFEGSDTVAGSRMMLRYYNAQGSFQNCFEQGHGATSVPAAEHSTITSWADVSEESDPVEYEKAEYGAFTNMIKQYMPSYAVSLVSDGFNIWNAVLNLWSSDDTSHGGESMKMMLAERLQKEQLTLIRPDSGEGIETLPQLLTVVQMSLPEHFQKDLPDLVPVFQDKHLQDRWEKVLQKIKTKVGTTGNPFRRFIGQQLRILQGDGVALDTIGDMNASLLANGFCANCVHFGSGGGLLQKLNRDSLGVAFKCCAMYVGGRVFPVGKDPIAGGKKSYGGNPPVIRGKDGVLRNRGDYDSNGEMIRALPMTYNEFINGAEGDQLKLVFEDGIIRRDQVFDDIKANAKITNLQGMLKKALENMEQKVDFFQRMTSDEAIAIRLAEASCGSKWKHPHPTKIAAIEAKYSKYAAAFQKLGINKDMDSVALLKHIKDNHVCDKKAKKTILRCVSEDDVDSASKAFNKAVVTL